MYMIAIFQDCTTQTLLHSYKNLEEPNWINKMTHDVCIIALHSPSLSLATTATTIATLMVSLWRCRKRKSKIKVSLSHYGDSTGSLIDRRTLPSLRTLSISFLDVDDSPSHISEISNLLSRSSCNLEKLVWDVRGLESLNTFLNSLQKRRVMPSVYQLLTPDSSNAESCLCLKLRFAEWESLISFIISRSSSGELFAVPGVATLQKVSLYSHKIPPDHLEVGTTGYTSTYRFQYTLE